MPDAEVERALVVAAHPDDIDFGSAATVAAWTAAGVEVTYCIVTDGDAGGFDPDVPREDIPAIRQAEQRAAAKVVGVEDVRFLGYQDGRLSVTDDLRRDLVRVIRQVRPQRALIPSPERGYVFLPPSHPDHLVTGEAAITAIYPFARNPFAFPELLRDEGLADWVVRETWLAAHPQTNHVVDVTETEHLKVEALRAHVSQTAHFDDLEGFVRRMLRTAAEQAGLGSDRRAETYWVLSTT